MRRRGFLREPVLREHLPHHLGAGTLSQVFIADQDWWASLLHGMGYHRLDRANATLCMRWTYNDLPVSYDAKMVTPLLTDRAVVEAENAGLPHDILAWADIVVEGIGRLVVVRVPEADEIVVRVYAMDPDVAQGVRLLAERMGLCRDQAERSRFLTLPPPRPSLNPCLMV